MVAAALPVTDSPAAPRPLSPSPIKSLDGLRGIAIAMVVINHFGLYAPVARDVPRWWATVYMSGQVGVDLFFVLSGYLITRILLAAREGPNYFGNFYARRTPRIFPLYYLVVVFVAFISPALFAKDGVYIHEAKWLLTYQANVRIAWHGFMGWHTHYDVNHFWSLAVEEQFYLVWPAVVLWFAGRRLRGVCLAVVGMALLTRAAIVLGHRPLEWAYFLTPCRLDALALGALLSLLPAAWIQLRRRWITAVGACCAAGFVAIMAADARRTMAFVGYSIIAMGMACGVALALVAPTCSRYRRTLESAPLRFLGRYSYGIYVFHCLFLPLLVPYLLAPVVKHVPSVVAGGIVSMLIGGGASTLIAMASFHFFEEPFLRLKRFFPYGATAPVAAHEPPPPDGNTAAPGNASC